jgi:hypothetical protein
MNELNLPKDKELAGKVVEAHAASEQTRLNRGLIGWFVGNKENVPNNVAGAVALITIVAFVAVLAVGEDTATVSKKDALAAITSILTLALGFLFGRATKE